MVGADLGPVKHRTQSWSSPGSFISCPLPEPQPHKRGNSAGVRSTALKIPSPPCLAGAACKPRCPRRRRAGEVPGAHPGIPAPASGEAEPEMLRRESGADSVTEAAGSRVFPPCNRPRGPALASRKQDPGESRGGIWSLDRRRQTCLVNINRRLEIAHGAGREAKARLCPVPCSSSLFLGAVLPQVGTVQPDLATLSLYQSITIGKDAIQLASQGTSESRAHP